jgi:hypothetical protein
MLTAYKKAPALACPPVLERRECFPADADKRRGPVLGCSSRGKSENEPAPVPMQKQVAHLQSIKSYIEMEAGIYTKPDLEKFLLSVNMFAVFDCKYIENMFRNINLTGNPIIPDLKRIFTFIIACKRFAFFRNFRRAMHGSIIFPDCILFIYLSYY